MNFKNLLFKIRHYLYKNNFFFGYFAKTYTVLMDINLFDPTLNYILILVCLVNGWGMALWVKQTILCDFRNTAYKKLLEYLFWIWDPQLPGGFHETTRVLEEGYMDAISYKVQIRVINLWIMICILVKKNRVSIDV